MNTQDKWENAYDLQKKAYGDQSELQRKIAETVLFYLDENEFNPSTEYRELIWACAGDMAADATGHIANHYQEILDETAQAVPTEYEEHGTCSI